MRLLLGCVNTTPSLIGYDWDKDDFFWTSGQIKVCGVCYDGNDLLVATDNFLLRLMADSCNQTEFKGKYDALMHSVHVMDDNLVGVVDTGNSQVHLLNKKGETEKTFNPVSQWGDIPKDAIHLNDFAVTPHGVLGSCFDYRPYKKVKDTEPWEKWCNGGYGVILNLDGGVGRGHGRIIGCGFDHPHSLVYVNPYLYICSSATGVFHLCEFDQGNNLREKTRFEVTADHFLRGAYYVDGHFFLGGSTRRHGQVIAKNIEIYKIKMSSGEIEKRQLKMEGEIYDILPWKDNIMQPIIKHHFPEN